ncbi:cytochrome c3 family protein [Coraliomargarita parva]|uniref:cytochrome c3 family protein n=1 Tax=Coraliomargarita parva TaxID=3014050 RepID=UPI0022B474A8|nr:NapC/NirT family cytochrome c [Coraliomargarita parva]
MSRKSSLSYFNNWISLCGAVIAIGSAFSFIFLFVMDLFAGHSNAYLGILTYIASPAFLILGMGLMLVGWFLHRRQILRNESGISALTFSLNLANRSDRKKFIIFTAGTFIFLILSAIGSYKTYHVTESVEFCGEVCHAVMEPEYTTYQTGAHARVACVECHIGSGAEWYVKSKLSGLYQVYSVALDKYNRPIETPVHNLRPARDTCEACHWPEKFTGNLDRTYPHFLADDENTPFTVRMSLNVGGADPRRGAAEGIHWHMSASNMVEFIAEDEQLQTIPWIRVTYPDGSVAEYVTPDFEGNPADYEIHKMDCMDCHNRPAHVFKPPSELVDQSLYLGQLPTELSGVKRLAVELLTGEYADSAEALAAIEAGLTEAYEGDELLTAGIQELQGIYAANFFPKMKADWSAYPNNIGHMNWPGCFRCHDDMHSTKDGSRTVEMSNCNSCHSILAQGSTSEELRTLHPDGVEFKHPGGDVEGFLCSDCHDGTLAE